VQQSVAYAVSLDSDAAHDPRQVGLRIALLARARSAGLPVRRGYCLTRSALAATLDGDAASQGTPAARRAAIREAPLPPTLSATLRSWGRSFAPQRVRGFSVDAERGAEVEGEVAEGICGPEALTQAVRETWWEMWLGAETQRRARAWPPAVAVLITDGATVKVAGRALSCVPGAAADGGHLILPDASSALHISSSAELVEGTPERVGLSRANLEQLVQLIAAAEELLGGPAEIDWVLRQRRVWLTQLRPQTQGVHRVEHLGAQAPGLEVWSNFSLREDLRSPLTPLSFGLWRDAFLPIVFESLTGLPHRATRERRMLPVDRISGRLYWNANRALATPVGALLLRLAPRLDPNAGAELQATLAEERLSPPALAGLRKLWALGHGALGLAGVVWRAFSGLRTAGVVYDCRRYARQQLRAARRPLGDLTDTVLIETIEQTVTEARVALRRGLAHELLGVVGLHALRTLWPHAPIGEVGQHGALVGPGALTLELRHLAQHLRQQPEARELTRIDQLGALLEGEGDAASSWRALLERSGHRGVDELELGTPRWREEPAPLLQALLDAVMADDAAATGPVSDEAAPARSTETGSEEDRRWLERWLQPLVGRFLLLRDFPRWSFAAGLAHLRVLYLECGRRLAERDLIATPDDVLMLEADEVRDLVLGLRRQQQLLRAGITRRRAQLALVRADQPPDTLRSDGRVATAAAAPSNRGDALGGIAASSGTVVARARLIADPTAAPPPRGEVLVAVALTPGWAPLLVNAAALVTEAGDWASHAAAMAREAGLPAVVGIAGVTRTLRDGDLIRVDGDRGTVELLPDAP